MNRREFLRAAGVGAAATIAIPAAQALAPLTGEQVALILPPEPEIIISAKFEVAVFDVAQRFVRSIDIRRDGNAQTIRIVGRSDLYDPRGDITELQKVLIGQITGTITIEYEIEAGCSGYNIADRLLFLWEERKIQANLMVTATQLFVEYGAVPRASFEGRVVA